MGNTGGAIRTPMEEYFPVGDPVQVEWKGEKFYSFLRAVKWGQFVALDVPRTEGKFQTFDYSSEFTVRFMHHGEVYGFKTIMTRVHTKPPLLIFEYPHELSHVPLRQSERMNILAPATVSSAEGKETSAVLVMDLSSSGALLRFSNGEDFPVGTLVKVTIPLDWGGVKITLDGEVKNISFVENGRLCGIQFFTPGDEDSKKLDSIMGFFRGPVSL